jgi:hypothetical protein
MYRDKKSPGIHAEAEVVQFEEVGRDEPAGSQSVREEGVVGAWRLNYLIRVPTKKGSPDTLPRGNVGAEVAPALPIILGTTGRGVRRTGISAPINDS